MAEETRTIEQLAEVSIGGKTVHFRKRLPQKATSDLLGLVDKADHRDTRTLIPVLAKLIESWEFDGDPAKVASYDDLDIFDEIMPLYRAADQYLVARMQRTADLKN